VTADATGTGRVERLDGLADGTAKGRRNECGVRISVLVCAAIGLAGFKLPPDASYKYKLTISVDTPEGMKTDWNVVELDYFRSWAGEPHRAYGQALVLDLGAHGTLVALLTQARRKAWGENDPSSIIFKQCGGDIREVLGAIDLVRGIEGCKAIYPVDLTDLPDIALFKNAKDPATAVVVDPRHPEASLGPGVTIRSATIQLTDEPLTRGVDGHLP
jgi:hypothetical protein